MRYLINEMQVDSNDDRFDQILGQAYVDRVRPICMCNIEGVEMYIAKIGDSYFIKRMPGSGKLHEFRCGSFEPPAELSGLGQVSGSAIKNEEDSELTKIKIDFSLAKTEGGRAPAIGEGNSKPGDVTSDPNKLTMRGLMHYLYEQSGFNRKDSVESIKRNWFNVRKSILHSSGGMAINGTRIEELMYIPETFILDNKEEIKERRRKSISSAIYKGTGKRTMMLVFGEVKAIEPDSYGYKIVLKHLPDFKFRISDDLHKKITKKYADELNIKEELHEDGHLLIMGTFFVNIKGYATLETCTLQIADENWIIFESLSEKYLMDALNESQRSYIKGLRYNLNGETPFASFVLTDTETPTALYINSPEASELYLSRQDKLVKESRYKSWFWEAEEDLPAFPETTPNSTN